MHGRAVRCAHLRDVLLMLRRKRAKTSETPCTLHRVDHAFVQYGPTPCNLHCVDNAAVGHMTDITCSPALAELLSRSHGFCHFPHIMYGVSYLLASHNTALYITQRTAHRTSSHQAARIAHPRTSLIDNRRVVAKVSRLLSLSSPFRRLRLLS